jgi:hypothetical protein
MMVITAACVTDVMPSKITPTCTAKRYASNDRVLVRGRLLSGDRVIIVIATGRDSAFLGRRRAQAVREGAAQIDHHAAGR